MKHPVNDALVAEYTKRLRSGGHVGAVFPQPLSECEFNEAQKFLIKEAHKVRKKLLEKAKPHPQTLPSPSRRPSRPNQPRGFNRPLPSQKP